LDTRIIREKGCRIKKGDDNMRTIFQENELLQKSVTFGIICALPKEYAAMISLIENGKNESFSKRGETGNVYYVGDIPATDGGYHHVAVSILLETGNNVASALAMKMIETFPNMLSIIMVGIAGGCPVPDKEEKNIFLGDVVVSDSGGVFQYDKGKNTNKIFEVSMPSHACDPDLVQACQRIFAELIKNDKDWLKYIDIVCASNNKDYARPLQKYDVFLRMDKKIRREMRDYPHVFKGKIGSANSVLKNELTRHILSTEYDVLACEMEGSGIADATWIGRKGYLLIRGISDYCDGLKNDKWQNYASATAAAFTRYFIERLPSSSERKALVKRNNRVENISFEIKCPHCNLSLTNLSGLCESCQTNYYVTSINDIIKTCNNSSNVLKYIKFYDSIIRFENEEPNVHISIGLCYLYLHNYKNALTYFESAIKLYLDNGDAHFYAAIAVLDGKRPFCVSRSLVLKASDYLGMAMTLSERGIYYYLKSLIVADYYEKKHLNCSLSSVNLNKESISKGITEEEMAEVKMLLSL
jgi:nucleoside phosphorylase